MQTLEMPSLTTINMLHFQYSNAEGCFRLASDNSSQNHRHRGLLCIWQHKTRVQCGEHSKLEGKQESLFLLMWATATSFYTVPVWKQWYCQVVTVMSLTLSNLKGPKCHHIGAACMPTFKNRWPYLWMTKEKWHMCNSDKSPFCLLLLTSTVEWFSSSVH